MDRDWLARRLEDGASYEAIAREAGCSASKVAWWAKRHGLASVHVERHAARGGLDAERLRGLVERHLTVRQIAAEVDRSPATVRHWLKRHGLQTMPSQHSAAGRQASEQDDDEALLYCGVHGMVRHVRRDTGYRCAQCRSAQVAARRRRVKQILVLEAGGACVRCGYRGSPRALEFHHVDPRQKRFALGSRGLARSIAALREEAAKCVLLCSNCHAEVEDGAPIGEVTPPTC